MELPAIQVATGHAQLDARMVDQIGWRRDGCGRCQVFGRGHHDVLLGWADWHGDHVTGDEASKPILRLHWKDVPNADMALQFVRHLGTLSSVKLKGPVQDLALELADRLTPRFVWIMRTQRARRTKGES